MAFSAEPSVITDELIREGYRYWRLKCGEHSLPRRADLDPSEIKPILPHVLLIDVLGPSRYRYRLIGTDCVTAHGVNAVGLTLDEALKDHEYRTHVISLYDQCVDERRPVYSESLFFAHDGHSAERHVKVLFMPLSDDGATVNMVFVVQVIRFMVRPPRDN
ncbi:MAG: PAS domain-containing protein [Alphaproteobacteria bacterium]|nr:PAS domain-containing protein [Alphaproteobacteria bacterium]